MTAHLIQPYRTGCPQRRVRLRRSAHTRRGAVYVLVLGVATMVAVVGIGVIALARSSGQASKATRDWVEAGTLAASGVELALGYINTTSTWRTDAVNRAWIGPLMLGDGRVAFTLVDEGDSDLANNNYDPVRVYVTATVGESTRVYSVQAAPSGPTGLSLLRSAVHADGGITVSGAITAASGPISSNVQVKNSGVLTADVECQTMSNSGTINGFVSSGLAARTMPPSTVVAQYSAMGSTISYSSLSGGDIQKCVLSAASNPYGSVNPAGVYVINVPLASRLRIRSCRIESTLVVKLGLLSSLVIEGPVVWNPPAGNKPSLIVQGAATSSVAIGGSAIALDEAVTGVSLNPVGTPYLGASDSDTSDKYPAELRGIFHITGSTCPVTITDSVATIGCVISEGAVTISAGARPTANIALVSTPPAGYSTGAVMKPVQGTYRWEAETVIPPEVLANDGRLDDDGSK